MKWAKKNGTGGRGTMKVRQEWGRTTTMNEADAEDLYTHRVRVVPRECIVSKLPYVAQNVL